ncbi:hypothetical protein M422DRAFT_98245, partial [Sphaerobolus stellatus SS14]
SSLPRLDKTGLNWAVFSVRFMDTVDAKGFWGHFDGSTPRPVIPDIVVTNTEGIRSTQPGTLTPEQQAALDQWDKNERSSRSLLTQKLPDSALMRVRSLSTVKERWAAIVKEYTEKGAYAQTAARTSFLASKCGDRENVREFLDNLCTKREELATASADIEDQDYQSTIINSLP